MRNRRKRKENIDRIYKTQTVEISPYEIEQEIACNISKFVLVPEGFSSENVRVVFEVNDSYCGPTYCFAITFSREETDEEYAERLEKIKKEEEKNKAAHEKRQKTAAQNKENKERELFEKLKKKYGYAE